MHIGLVILIYFLSFESIGGGLRGVMEIEYIRYYITAFWLQTINEVNGNKAKKSIFELL